MSTTNPLPAPLTQANLNAIGAAFKKAFEPVIAVATSYVTAVAHAWSALRLLIPQTDARLTLGPRNFTADGQWQSDMCAAWVHDSCGLPDWCDCTCHGGTLR